MRGTRKQQEQPLSNDRGQKMITSRRRRLSVSDESDNNEIVEAVEKTVFKVKGKEFDSPDAAFRHKFVKTLANKIQASMNEDWDISEDFAEWVYENKGYMKSLIDSDKQEQDLFREQLCR
jgi:hypothetical protein